MRAVIAIVDDDESVRDALTSLMASHNYDAIGYTSAEEFIQSTMRGSTECVITDIALPGMTGLEMYDLLVEWGERIPTIFITAHSKESVRGRVRAMNACYLIKPFAENELLACVREALDQSDANH